MGDATEQKAHELGRLLGQTSEYKQLREARERMEQETELRQNLEKLDKIAESISQAVTAGGQPGESDRREYEKLLSSIQGSPTYQMLIAAQTNFDKLMTRVNDQIVAGMEKGAASPIITLS